MENELQISDRIEASSAPAPPVAQVLDARVVFLTHYIPVYKLPVLQALSRGVRDFRVLVSTEIEPNRHFEPDWEGLNVSVQKTVTLNRMWKHTAGFIDQLYVHLPYDTGKQLRQLKPDVILSHELGFRSIASAFHRIRNPGQKLVLCTFMSEHTEQGRGRIRPKLRRWLMRRADALTYNGPECLRVLDDLGADVEKCFHFPYAANPKSLYRGPLSDDTSNQCRLICVGQLSERKGVSGLVDQLTAYATDHAEREFVLTLVGEGPLKEPLSARETPANFHLDLKGYQDAEKLPGLMLQHDALVFPTLADEWGLVVNEALHSGLPVLGSRLAQASTTLLSSGENGWIYDPLKPGSLARALDSMLNRDAHTILSMRTNCRESVEHITPEWAASGVLDACRFVLSR